MEQEISISIAKSGLRLVQRNATLVYIELNWLVKFLHDAEHGESRDIDTIRLLLVFSR